MKKLAQLAADDRSQNSAAAACKLPLFRTIPYDNFPLGQLFDKGLTVKFGQASVHKYVDELIALVEDGKIKLNDIISHRLLLDSAADAYRMFDKEEEDCVKMVLNP